MAKNNNHKESLDMKAIALLAVRERGQIPWKPRKSFENYSRISEVEYAYNMARSTKYLFNDGVMNGKPDYQRIACELNKVYHCSKKVRNRYTVRNALYKYKKTLENC
jgi:hypothetical protein